MKLHAQLLINLAPLWLPHLLRYVLMLKLYMLQGILLFVSHLILLDKLCVYIRFAVSVVFLLSMYSSKILFHPSFLCLLGIVQLDNLYWKRDHVLPVRFLLEGTLQIASEVAMFLEKSGKQILILLLCEALHKVLL